MDIILSYIFIALAGLLIVFVVSHLLRTYIENNAEKHKQQKIEKEKWKYKKAKLDNPVLNSITKSRFIVCKGEWGHGKTLMMSFILHFLYQKQQEKAHKQRRFMRIMLPEKLKEREQLENNKLLPVYTNLDVFVDRETGFHADNIYPYLFQAKKAVEGGLFGLDEIASDLGKSLYYKSKPDDPVIEELNELFKKFRHYINGWFVGTEQDGVDLYVGIRKNGYALVDCKETNKRLPWYAKFLRKTLNICNAILPGMITADVRKLFLREFWTIDKVKLFFKLLLPTYFTLPVEYYTRRTQIYNFVNNNFLLFRVRFEFAGKEYWLEFRTKDFFEYNTRAYQGEYDKKFDSNNERKLFVEAK